MNITEATAAEALRKSSPQYLEAILQKTPITKFRYTTLDDFAESFGAEEKIRILIRAGYSYKYPTVKYVRIDNLYDRIYPQLELFLDAGYQILTTDELTYDEFTITKLVKEIIKYRNAFDDYHQERIGRLNMLVEETQK